MDSCNQLVTVEWLGQIIISTKTEAFNLAFRVVRTRQDQDWCFNPRKPELAQHLVTIHVRQIEIQKDQIVIIKFCQIDPFFTKRCRVDVQVGMGQHHIDAL